MNYRVRLVLSEVYSVWVEADSEEEAEHLACNALHKKLLQCEEDILETTIEEVE